MPRRRQMPNVILHEQGSPEWLSYRSFRIGASDLPIIIGTSPYKTPFQLYQEKIGCADSVETPNMTFGKQQESLVRDMVNNLLGTDYFPIVFQHTDHHWAMCSLDGYSSGNNGFIEIKCANAEDHEMASKGIVPEKYQAQIQWQFFVSGCSIGTYVSYHKGNIVHFHVKADLAYIADLKDKAEEFYIRVINLNPPPLTEDDYHVVDEPELVSLAEEFAAKKIAYEEMGRWIDATRATLIENMKNDRNMCGSLKLEKFTRKGSVNYHKIPELKSIDLDQYRSESVDYWKVATKCNCQPTLS